ncbi:hypothetical protein HPB48_012806 [Haemaphysalis longicornis]|uniref:ABC transporter domain-containing protein n=1 Tax=Haemaphysalis longicornis TaxID=44386 RepID=A0A9J6FWP9_HAELO|nr:hypothetical protein HPB48_012806 [Haemaphysalis longicornis]
MRRLTLGRRLGFERERNHILRNTSFKAYPEELLVVVGPSGAGKTSLVRTMTGLDVSSAGQVIVEGFDVGSQTWSARRNMGVVLQEPMLLSDMTVHEHLLFFGTVAGLLGEPLVKRVLEVEELLHLKGVADTQAADLGIPVKKRLDLAVAILPQPRVLILDEPMLRMDVTSRFIVWEMLKSVKQSSCVIMTSSNIDDVLVLADRVAILGFGGLKCYGTLAFLRQRFGCGYNLRDRRNICNIVLGDRAEHEVVSSVLHTVELRKAKYSIASYAVSVITIEDIFVRVIFEMDASTIQDKRHAAEDKAKREMNKRLAVTGATIAEGSDNVVLISTAAVGGVTTSPGEQYESSVQIEEHFFLHFSADRLVYDLKELHPRAEVLLSHDSTSAQLAKSFDDTVSASHHVRAVPNMTEYMNQLKRDRRAVEDALVGAQFVDDGDPSKPARAIAWYHGDAYHTQSASANLVGTALLRWASNDPEALMLSMLQPMRRQNRSIYSRSLRRYKAVAEMHTLLSTRLIRFVMLPMVTSVTAASLVLFAIDDRVSNSKAMQFTSGVPPSVYWMANYVWDILMSFIALVCVFFPVMICHTLFYMIGKQYACS